MSLPRWSAPAAALLGAALAVVLFSSTGQDDGHITFWSAWALAELGEIVNHSGQRVEQSSSLLHTLALAAFHRVTGAPLPWLGYLLGIVASVATVVRLPSLARAYGWELWGSALCVLATSPTFAYWQLGMLETSLFTWCCVEFLIRLARLHDPADERSRPRRPWLGFALATVALAAVRPEAGILAVCVCAASMLAAAVARERRSASLRPSATALAIALAAFAGLVLFRLAYFDSAFPQPVSAKVGGAGWSAKLADGALYLGARCASASGALLVVGAISGLATGVADLRAGRTRRLGVVVLTSAYVAFIVLSGGDWMKGWRFVAHIGPLVLFLLFQGMATLTLGGRLRAGICAALFLVNVFGMIRVGGAHGTGRPIWTAWQVDPAVMAFANASATWPERANQVHTRDVVMVDEMNEVVRKVLLVKARATILSKQAGLVTYYAAREHYGRIEFIDRLGLSSSHFDAVREELDLPTGPMGLAWDLEDIFRLGDERPDDAIYRPDVIFDLHRLNATLVEREGYVVVYEQAGLTHGRFATARDSGDAPRPAGVAPMDLLRVRPRTGTYDGRSPWSEETNMYQFIAVRADLAQDAGLTSVGEARRLFGADQAVTPQSLFWDEARVSHLRR